MNVTFIPVNSVFVPVVDGHILVIVGNKAERRGHVPYVTGNGKAAIAKVEQRVEQLRWLPGPKAPATVDLDKAYLTAAACEKLCKEREKAWADRKAANEAKAAAKKGQGQGAQTPTTAPAGTRTIAELEAELAALRAQVATPAATPAAPAPAAEAPKRRGRPPGSKNRAKPEATPAPAATGTGLSPETEAALAALVKEQAAG